jgi:hypothetical protein
MIIIDFQLLNYFYTLGIWSANFNSRSDYAEEKRKERTDRRKTAKTTENSTKAEQQEQQVKYSYILLSIIFLYWCQIFWGENIKKTTEGLFY